MCQTKSCSSGKSGTHNQNRRSQPNNHPYRDVCKKRKKSNKLHEPMPKTKAPRRHMSSSDTANANQQTTSRDFRQCPTMASILTSHTFAKPLEKPTEAVGNKAPSVCNSLGRRAVCIDLEIEIRFLIILSAPSFIDTIEPGGRARYHRGRQRGRMHRFWHDKPARPTTHMINYNFDIWNLPSNARMGRVRGVRGSSVRVWCVCQADILRRLRNEREERW